jgi:hypothetical protein
MNGTGWINVGTFATIRRFAGTPLRAGFAKGGKCLLNGLLIINMPMSTQTPSSTLQISYQLRIHLDLLF